MTEWTITVAIAVVAIIAIAFPARVYVKSSRRPYTHVLKVLGQLLNPMPHRERLRALIPCRFESRHHKVKPSPLDRVRVSYPKRLSKGFSSNFLVSLYNPAGQAAARREIQREFANQDHLEKNWKAKLPADEMITIRLASPSIEFTEPARFNSNTEHVSTSFVAKPTDTIDTGSHSVRVDITNETSKEEYFSGTFQVRVVDFVFDHVSQPLISRVAWIVAACASGTTFVLTIFEKIDMTPGLASGAGAAVASGAIYGRFRWLFRRSTSQDVVE